jgi:hypothetical protein
MIHTYSAYDLLTEINGILNKHKEAMGLQYFLPHVTSQIKPFRDELIKRGYGLVFTDASHNKLKLVKE